MNRQTRGAVAEAWAQTHLEEYGLRLAARNWRCRLGELDLVMFEGDTLVFVEVRYRSHSGFGGAEYSVDARKQRRVAAAAQVFLLAHPQWSRRACRFDVVAIAAGNQHTPPLLNWIRGAFEH
ncbi:YraN family protein [Pseudomonas sp. NW5]|uniref:YraN family protein n=1 Tax=Pseudomonas sp. NW5 TaxID=2934934 RepID=UPI00201FB870|nr:YraN family protein [Pseudomonas sp. NW5]